MWIHGEFSTRWLGAAVNNTGMIMSYGAPVVKMEWNESNNYILLYVPSEIKRCWEPNTLFAYVTHIAVSNYLPWLFFLPVYYLYISLLECKLSVWEEVPFLHSTPENVTQSGNSVDTSFREELQKEVGVRSDRILTGAGVRVKCRGYWEVKRSK